MASRVYKLVVNVGDAHVGQLDCLTNDPSLNRGIGQMVILNSGCRLDLNHSVVLSLRKEQVGPNQESIALEGGLEEGHTGPS